MSDGGKAVIQSVSRDDDRLHATVALSLDDLFRTQRWTGPLQTVNEPLLSLERI